MIRKPAPSNQHPASNPRVRHAVLAIAAALVAGFVLLRPSSGPAPAGVERGSSTAEASRTLNAEAEAEHARENFEGELEIARRMQALDESLGWLRIPELRALAALGRHDELARRMESAMSLPVTLSTPEPFSPGDALVQVARELHARGDTVLARSYYTRAEAWYDELPDADLRDPSTGRALARIQSAEGRWFEALSTYQGLLYGDSASSEYWGGLAIAAFRLGDTTTPVSVMKRLRADRTPNRLGAPALWAARIAAALGRKEDAVALLREAIRDGYTGLYLLHHEPEFESLRDYEPFRALLKPKG